MATRSTVKMMYQEHSFSQRLFTSCVVWEGRGREHIVASKAIQSELHAYIQHIPTPTRNSPANVPLSAFSHILRTYLYITYLTPLPITMHARLIPLPRTQHTSNFCHLPLTQQHSPRHIYLTHSSHTTHTHLTPHTLISDLTHAFTSYLTHSPHTSHTHLTSPNSTTDEKPYIECSDNCRISQNRPIK